MAWSEDRPDATTDRGVSSEGSSSRPRWEEEAPAPLGLDRSEGRGAPPTLHDQPALALLERPDGGRSPAAALREAERLLSDLCARVEDAELWDQLRSARDLVREAVALVGR
jgi:hypothetical protein